MAYSIVESSASTFVSSRMELPRFQRKQTWGNDKNFKLCISVFKGYPLGVVIINELGKTSCLLDGRQRLNALKKMIENPVELYMWARVFLKLKPSDTEADVKDKFYDAIEAYLQKEFDDDVIDENDADNEEVLPEPEQSFDPSIQMENLGVLLSLILLMHGKYKNEYRLIGMFKFDNIIPVRDLEYVPTGSNIVNPMHLKRYIKTCIQDKITTKELFEEALVRRYRVPAKDHGKLSLFLDKHWDYFENCFSTIEKADEVISNSKIGVIRLINATMLDAQNIFSLVNEGGEKLKPEELLSARPFWNVRIENPRDEVREQASKLYKQLSIDVPPDIVRWDLCATLLSRIDKNHLIFSNLDISKTNEFTKKLTLGFKLVSGAFVGGISSAAVTELEKGKKDVSFLSWDTDIDKFANDFNLIISIIEDCDFFKYVMSWKQSVSSLLGTTIALEFSVLMYKKWHSLGQPQKNSISKIRELHRDSIILFDRLIYEYAAKIWSGSSNTRVQNDLRNENLGARFQCVKEDDWMNLLDSIYNKSYTGPKGAAGAIIYYYYCLKRFAPTIDLQTTYQVDHIIPQKQFAMAVSVDSAYKDMLYNLAILPQRENDAKNDRSIIDLKSDPWLYNECLKFSEVPEADAERFSDICNIEDMIKMRYELYREAFSQTRSALINNQ